MRRGPRTRREPWPLRLTLARVGDTLHDDNGTRVAAINAFTTVNPETGGNGPPAAGRWTCFASC